MKTTHLIPPVRLCYIVLSHLSTVTTTLFYS